MTASTMLATLSADTLRKETDRLTALQQFDLLDSPMDPGFDRIVRLIREIYAVEIGLISLMDAHRQWYKACDGLAFSEIPRQDSFCRYVVVAEEPIIVPDATCDPRFAEHPAVTGDLHVRFYAGMPLKTQAGHTIGTVCAIGKSPREFDARDISILSELAGAAMDRIELLQTASTDVLTDALTRRAFKQEADGAHALALRHGHPLSCIVLDVDHFKAVNDTHGHAAGDTVLKAVAAACRAELRTSDMFGRLGGEEFVVMLPHVDIDGALVTAERLRGSLAAQRIDCGNATLSVTASFGVSAISAGGGNVETLLAQADAAMYQAKNLGRNRCRSWTSLNTERPTGARKRVLRTGFILLDARRQLIDCTVKSLGSDSAGLSLSSSDGIPDEFLLQIPADGLERQCRVIAKGRQHLEVAFH